MQPCYAGNGDDWKRLTISERTVQTLRLLSVQAARAVLKNCTFLRLAANSSKMRGVLAAGACCWLLMLILIAIPMCLSQVVVVRRQLDGENDGNDGVQSETGDVNGTLTSVVAGELNVGLGILYM